MIKTHNPECDAPFNAFVQAMLKEHADNRAKGDREGWLKLNEREATAEVLYHIAKLCWSSQQWMRGDGVSSATVREHAADVANCAMMLADICGVLNAQE